MGANVLTLLAVYGMVQVARAEREERETGKKVPVPGYIYLSILLPAALAASCLYFIS